MPTTTSHTSMTTGSVHADFRAEQLFETPNVWMLYNLLSEEECDHLVQQAVHKLAPCTTVDPQTGEYIVIEDRNSFVTFFGLNQDPVITTVEARIATLINVPMPNGEGLQVIRYQVGQEYKPHFDYFDPALPGSHKALSKGGQRIATILMYLSDVEEGGETILPKIGLSVKPQKRNALLFYSVNQLGVIDPETLHGSVPVVRGEKWVSTKWIREREFRDYD